MADSCCCGDCQSGDLLRGDLREGSSGGGGAFDGVAGASDDDQVWSLTQFYSVDPSLSRIGAVSTNAQSRFASAVLDGVLGPPRLARHT